MKSTQPLLIPSLLIAGLASLTGSASAQGIKADNANALNLASSWVGSTPPTASTLMIVDATLTAARTVPLGDNLSVLGITDTSTKTLTVNGTTGKFLNIGSSGISQSGTGGLTLANDTNLGGNVTLPNTGAGALTFSGPLALTANQTWSLGVNRINVTSTLTTAGNTLNISAKDAFSGILNFGGVTTIDSNVTIGTVSQVYAQGASVTFNGTNNTNTNFNVFAGTASIASMGNLNGASSIGKGSAYVRSNTTLNYTGTTASSNKGFTRDTNGSATPSDTNINVTTAGETLSMSGNLTPSAGLPTTVGGWKFGGAGNLALSGNITNGTSTTVTKIGTGTLTLSGNNTYTGGTTVSAGTLQVGSGGVGSTGPGTVQVQSGATLTGTGTVKTAAFTAASGANLQAGDGTASGDFGTLGFVTTSGSGTFDLQSGSNTTLGLNPGGTGDKLAFDGSTAGTLNFSGNLTVTAPAYVPAGTETFNLLDWTNITSTNFDSRYNAASYSGFLLGNGDDSLGFDLPDISGSGYAWDISNFTTNGTIVTVAIPEPHHTALLLLGLTALFAPRRRRVV